MNKVILMGRLTKDPEVRYINNNNTAVCNFTLAVDRKFQKETDFIPIVAWNKLAEFCSKYFTKGMRVAIVGSIQTRTWDDNKEINIMQLKYLRTKLILQIVRKTILILRQTMRNLKNLVLK